MLAIQRSSRSTPKFQIWFNHHNPKPHSIISASENLATLLQSCNQISEIVQVHGFMVKTGLQQDPFSVSKLLASSIRDARYAASIFENIRHPNLFMFNSMLRAYSISETPGKAFSIFRDLRTRSILLDRFSFVTTLKACARELAVETGRMIHGVVVRSGHLVFVEVKNALLHFYGVCGETYLARKLFDEMPDNNDLVSWNILMAVSLPDMAMGLFKEMSRRGEGVSEATLLTFLSSFGGSEYSLGDEGIALLMLMKDEQVKPNSSTLASLLSSCAANGSIKLGKYLSTFVEEEAMTLDAVLGTALIDMFAKSGFLNKAIDIFDRMVSKDVKSWTAMILSYGIHGRSRDALALFYRMEEERFVPNEVTFLALLSACSHGGMVAEAMDCFRRMVGRYGLVPMVEHYGCITDLLGRAGLLKEARGLIESLPIKNDATAWRALLAACRVHGDVELGEKATRVLVEMGDRHPTDSMLLLSSYAVAGRLEDRWSSQETGVKHKEVGCSMIEVENS
ncbi:Pentatricopeptide repeat-containing protein At1g26900, mitochondrial [Linum grandiflorum]